VTTQVCSDSAFVSSGTKHNYIKNTTLGINDTELNAIGCCAEFHYAGYRILKVLLSVVMLNVVMLSVVMLSVVVLFKRTIWPLSASSG